MSTASSSSPGLSIRKGVSLPSSPTLRQTRAVHTPNVEAVARTHANNKRLRKDGGGSPPTKQRIAHNGLYSNKERVVGDSALCASSLVPTPVESLTAKSGSTQNTPNLVASDNDIVKAKMAQIGRIAKVKTTQELLEDLKARGGSPPPQSSASKDGPEPSSRHRALNVLLAPRSPDDVSRNKTEHMAKFLSSQPDDGKRSYSPSPLGSPVSREIEEILSALPPVDLSAINWSDDEDYQQQAALKKEVTQEPLLSGQNLEGVTGNWENLKTETGDGDSELKTVFKEWHEPVWRDSYDGQKLLVWPYVITD